MVAFQPRTCQFHHHQPSPPSEYFATIIHHHQFYSTLHTIALTMARPKKRKQLMRELAKEGKRKHNLKDSDRNDHTLQEEYRCESLEVEDEPPLRAHQDIAQPASLIRD